MMLKYYSSNIQNQRAFTVVEILIVIVVIAIIAAIALVSYTTLRVRGIESTMQSDLRQTAAAIENDNTRNGTFPADLSVANKGAGIEMRHNS